MQIRDYAERVKSVFRNRPNQGIFMQEVFNASGNNFFPKPKGDMYAKKICNGTKPITPEMARMFPHPYPVKKLADYFQQQIDDSMIPSLAIRFGLTDGDISKSSLCMALAVQFFDFVEAGGEKNDVPDRVLTCYQEFVHGADVETVLNYPYYPGDDIWVIRGQGSRYNKGFYEKFEHSWLIRNRGSVAWSGRKLTCRDNGAQSARLSTYEIAVPHIDPAGEATITVGIDSRGAEKISRFQWEMVDAEGNDCFPNYRNLFDFSVEVVNQFREKEV